MLSHRFGTPAPLEILLFLGGATGGYAGLALLAGRYSGDPQPSGRHLLVTGAVQFVAVGAALVAAALASGVGPPFAWAAAGFLATAIFLMVASAELTFAVIRESESGGR